MATFTMGTGGHYIIMLPADWSISTSHVPLPSSCHSEKKLWNPSIVWWCVVFNSPSLSFLAEGVNIKLVHFCCYGNTMGHSKQSGLQVGGGSPYWHSCSGNQSCMYNSITEWTALAIIELCVHEWFLLQLCQYGLPQPTCKTLYT